MIKRKTKVVTLSLPPEMLKIAKDLAKKEHRTLSELFRESLRHYSSIRSQKKG